MKDDRIYAKFTLDFPSDPKIKPLSDGAFRCLVESIIWSRQHLTNGLLPRRYALASFCLDLLEELCTNDDVNPSFSEVETGYLIHDFCEHQTTKEEIEHLRKVRQTAGRKGGLASSRSKREATAQANAKQKVKQTRSKFKPETETETDNSLTPKPGVRECARPPAGRLPHDWRPASNVVAQMRSEHPHVNLEYELAKFTDYWTALDGAGATKRDWPATYRNWIRRAAEQTPTQRLDQTSTPRSKVRAYAELAQKLRTEEQNQSRKELLQ